MPDTPYLLVVTDGVKAADGSGLARADFDIGHSKDFGTALYRIALLASLHWSGTPPSRIADASLFTTFALAAQQQIATFLGSGGTTTIDPDGACLFFETPIAGPLPEALNFIP
jgi:hypothetical protein